MPFLQHIAMKVTQSLPETLSALTKTGAPLTPRPDASYYSASSRKLIQRPLLTLLLNQLQGVDIFDDIQHNRFHPQAFNALFFPYESDIAQLKQLLSQNNINPHSIARFIAAFQQIQPVLQHIEKAFPTGVNTQAKPLALSVITQAIVSHGFTLSDSLRQKIHDLVDDHYDKMIAAKDNGYLIDYENRNLSETGYFVQKFSVPGAIAHERTVSHFNEFIQRCDGLDSENKSTHCGAFGQGNFKSLMESQQKGIKEAESKVSKPPKAHSKSTDTTIVFPRASMEVLLTQGLVHPQLELLASKFSDSDAVQQSLRDLKQLQSAAEAAGIPQRLAKISGVAYKDQSI